MMSAVAATTGMTKQVEDIILVNCPVFPVRGNLIPVVTIDRARFESHDPWNVCLLGETAHT